MSARFFSGSFILWAFQVALWLGNCQRPVSSVPDPRAGMRLVWADEFDREGLPDSSRWSYDVGDGCPGLCGWGNNELQYYTEARPENARVKDGCLILEARRELMGNRTYTSARLVSRQKGDWTYGRVEVRVRVPEGLGVWPAVWMLPTAWAYGEWPKSGEIDIMEHVGYLPDTIFGSIHTEAFNHLVGTQVTQGVFNASASTQFHTYGVQWSADKIDFFQDGKVYQTFFNTGRGAAEWPFDQDFHLVLNLAVGGNWGGRKGVDETIWPRSMLVDYVRVYRPESDFRSP